LSKGCLFFADRGEGSTEVQSFDKLRTNGKKVQASTFSVASIQPPPITRSPA
jgi:hypothetical protein